MPTPFLGMDPYLERPNLWSNVHNSLIAAIRDFLTPRLRPRYFVAIEERSYLEWQQLPLQHSRQPGASAPARSFLSLYHSPPHSNLSLAITAR